MVEQLTMVEALTFTDCLHGIVTSVGVAGIFAVPEAQVHEMIPVGPSARRFTLVPTATYKHTRACACKNRSRKNYKGYDTTTYSVPNRRDLPEHAGVICLVRSCIVAPLWQKADDGKTQGLLVPPTNHCRRFIHQS